MQKRHRRGHLSQARRCGVGDRTRGAGASRPMGLHQTAASARSAADLSMGRAAHSATAAKDFAGNAGLELRALVRRRTARCFADWPCSLDISRSTPRSMLRPARRRSGSRASGAIDSLIAKSMVATRPIGAMMRYRLLDTTRAYILGVGSDDPETANLAAATRFTSSAGWSNAERNGRRLSSGTERRIALCRSQ